MASSEFSGVLLLNEDEVRRLLPMDQAIAAVEAGLRQLALDEAQNVPRARAQTEHVMLHVLSAAAKSLPTPAGPGAFLAAKLYTTSRNHPARFLVPLFDGSTGRLLALIQRDPPRGAIGQYFKTLLVVHYVPEHDLAQNLLVHCRICERHQRLDAPVEIARHHVG